MCKRTPLEKGKEIIFAGHRFRISGVCGYGTSSIVYYAEDTGNNYQVIVKEIYPAGLGITRNDDGSLVIPTKESDIFKEYIERAKKAYELQTKLHNNVSTNNATLFTYAQENTPNKYYCASELKAGCTLSDWIKNHKGDNKAYIPGLLKICRHITGVLKAYHENEPSYIHLDIKPANILVVPIDEKNYIIQMFDFDSVYTIEELKNDHVRYSPGYAAPEVMYFPYNIDIDHTDIYSVGAILYEGIFGKPPEDEETEVWHRFDFSEVRALDGFPPVLKPKLREILKKTLSIVVSSRFTAGELCSALDEAVKIAEKDLFIPDDDIRSSEPVSRIEDLEMIHKEFENKKAAYIHGIRGSGKSVLARKYAEQFRNEYTTVREIIFDSDDSDSGISAEKTICQQLLNKSKEITIKHICDNILGKFESKTLILLINFEANDANNDILAQMLKASNENVRFIITSRNTHDCIKKIDDKYLFEMSSNILSDSLKQDITTAFFEIADKNEKFDDAGRKYFKMFLKGINYHFMTVFLIADYCNGLNSESINELIAELKENGISSDDICDEYNEEPIINIIKKVFNMKGFNDEEKYILLNACLLPAYGMSEPEFLKSIGKLTNKHLKTNKTCSILGASNWLIRDTEKKYIMMHTIIKEVCISELIFETQKPFNFDLFIPLLRGLSSKLDLSAGNTEYIFLSLAVCNSLSELSKAKNTELSPAILPLIENIKNKGINYKDQMKLLSSILCDEYKGVLNPLLTNFADFFKINS